MEVAKEAAIQRVMWDRSLALTAGNLLRTLSNFQQSCPCAQGGTLHKFVVMCFVSRNILEFSIDLQESLTPKHQESLKERERPFLQ